MRYPDQLLAFVVVLSSYQAARTAQGSRPREPACSRARSRRRAPSVCPAREVTVTGQPAGKQVTEILSGEDGHFSVVGLAPGTLQGDRLARVVRHDDGDGGGRGRPIDRRRDRSADRRHRRRASRSWPRARSCRAKARWRRPRRSAARRSMRSRRAAALQATHAAARERHRGAQRRQHQRRPAEPGRRAARRRTRWSIPSTGLSKVMLPDDAIESVSVLPNPYAVEFGRFSSGVVVIQTRRAGDMWKLRINDIDPTFRTHRGSPVEIIGLGRYAPRVEFGGPIIKDRLFLQQAMQFVYSASGRAEPAGEPAAHVDVVQLVHARRREPDAAPFAGRRRSDSFPARRTAICSARSCRPTRPSTRTCAQTRSPSPSARVWTDSLFGETTRPRPRLSDRRDAAGRGADAAPAGHDARQLLQRAAPRHRDLPGHRVGVRARKTSEVAARISSRSASTCCATRTTARA